jgi:hypothetical protein
MRTLLIVVATVIAVVLISLLLLVTSRAPAVDYEAIYRNLVFVSAADSEDGVKMPPQIFARVGADYKPMKEFAPCYETHSLYPCWVRDTNRTIYVTAEGYSTQTIHITKARCIVAVLDRLDREKK